MGSFPHCHRMKKEQSSVYSYSVWDLIRSTNQLELNQILAKEKAQEEKQKHQQLHSWKEK